MRVVLYALGGGHGHAARAALLAPALVDAGATVTVLAARPPPRDVGSVTWRALPRPSSKAALRRVTMPALREADHVVVDTFPEGVLDELDDACLDGRAATVLLRLRRDAAHPRFATACARYDARLDLEPHLGWLPSAIAATPVGPFVAPRFPDDGAVADVLFLPGDDEGLRGLCARLAPLVRARGVSTRVDDGGPVRPRVVVGAAGFTLTYEARAHGIAHVAIPVARPFDDQHRRARALAITPPSPEACIDAIVAAASAAHAPDPVALPSARDVARMILGAGAESSTGHESSSSTGSGRRAAPSPASRTRFSSMNMSQR